jgi:hypothetical protein
MPPRAKGRAPPRSQGKGKGKGKGAKNQQSLKFDDDEVDDIDGDNQGPLVSLDLQSSDDSDASEASGASDDESGESDSDNDNKTKAGKAAPDDEDEGDSEGSDEDDVSDEDDEEDDESSDDDRDDTIDTAWGRSASAYHGGDTADLEIGQDEEEAREEAAIARKMQKQRRAKETEDDFLILGDTEADAATAAIGASSAGSSKRGKASKGSGAKEEAIALRDLNDMGESERLAALRAEAPELEGLLAQLEEALGEASLLGLALSEAHGLQVIILGRLGNPMECREASRREKMLGDVKKRALSSNKSELRNNNLHYFLPENCHFFHVTFASFVFYLALDGVISRGVCASIWVFSVQTGVFTRSGIKSDVRGFVIPGAALPLAALLCHERQLLLAPARGRRQDRPTAAPCS